MIMKDWPGLLSMRQDRIGTVKIRFDYAGLSRTTVDEEG